MRFSRNWIAAYTRLPETERELEEALSGLGLVVDALDARGDDVILDLDVPTNRPDVMNHVGIARELAIALERDLEPPTGAPATDGPPVTELAALTVEDSIACPRFVACALVDVEVGPSPDWLVARLDSIGVRPINSVVDITNYVMWELGRPMHAYDLDRLAGNRLVVRRARAGEGLLTLDGVQRELSGEDLVIADAQRVVGLAGVMGGELTGVTESTERVLLECALFDPSQVRAMARRHGMHTDASHRFERGLSHQGIMAATRRAAALICEITGGRCCAGEMEARGELPEPTRIALTDERISGLLGDEVPAERIAGILERLGFAVQRGDDSWDLSVPPERLDVRRPVDVIEEIARFWGYRRLPSTLPVLRRARRSGAAPELRDQTRLRDLMTGLGYWEGMTYVFSHEEEQRRFLGNEQLVRLANPLSEAMGVLRARLAPGLLRAVARNLNVATSRVRLFELGRVFREADDGPPIERGHLGFVATGTAAPEHFRVPDRPFDFLDLKGALEAVARRMGWADVEWHGTALPGLQDGSAASITCGDASGFAGRVDAAIAEAFGIDAPVWVAELDVHDLLGAPRQRPAVVAPPRYPSAERDVSLLLQRGTPWSRIRRTVVQTDEIPLESLDLVDVYEGEDLPAGHVAMTLRLTYRSRERTLTAEQIEAAQGRVVDRLEAALGARRR